MCQNNTVAGCTSALLKVSTLSYAGALMLSAATAGTHKYRHENISAAVFCVCRIDEVLAALEIELMSRLPSLLRRHICYERNRSLHSVPMSVFP